MERSYIERYYQNEISKKALNVNGLSVQFMGGS